MRADGTHKRRLISEHKGFHAFAPSFTPDGRKIVFTRCHPEPKDACALWIARADGKRKHALTPFVHGSKDIRNDFNAQVSPNGRLIAFGRFDAGGIRGQIMLMRADGSHVHSITAPKYEAFQPDWAPNGKRIAFSSQAPRPGSSVFTVKPDGSGVHRLTPDRYPNNDADPAYSPRGDRIAFISDRKYDDLCCADLFSMRSDGGKGHRIPTGKPGAGILDPAWGTAPIIR